MVFSKEFYSPPLTFIRSRGILFYDPHIKGYIVSKQFLTTGKAKKKVEKAPDGKFFDYQGAVIAQLRNFGMKQYYAELSVIDFKMCLTNGWYDKEPPDVVAVKVLVKAKKGYTGKVMVADGSCIYSGTK